jgi:hypothetical protein
VSTDLDAAVTRLTRTPRPEDGGINIVSSDDLRLLLADWERLREKLDQFESYGLTVDTALKERAERDAARAEVERLSVQVAASAQGPLHELLGMCGGVDRCDFCGRIGPHVAGCKAPAIEALVRLAWVDVPDWDRWWSPADYADHEAELARLRERDARVRAVLGNPAIDRQTAITRALELLKETS